MTVNNLNGRAVAIEEDLSRNGRKLFRFGKRSGSFEMSDYLDIVFCQ